MPDTPDGKPQYPLIEELLLMPHRFGYAEAVKLLRAFWGQELKIRTRPALNLSFNASDIQSITILDLTRPEISDEGKIRSFHEISPQELLERWGGAYDPPVEVIFSVNFLGLYGSSSPLPIYYTEALMRDEGDDNPSTADFMALINEPSYQAWQEAKGKYRIFNLMAEGSQPPELLLERIFTFAGLSVPEIRRQNSNIYELLPHLGAFSMMPRSAEGMAAIFRTELDSCQVDLETFVPGEIEIPVDQIMELGVINTTLGEDAYLGDHIPCADGRIRVHVLCPDSETFDSLMPGGELHLRLARIMKPYMTEHLQIMIHGILENSFGDDLYLGDSTKRLGVNCFLGSTGGFFHRSEFDLPLEY